MQAIIPVRPVNFDCGVWKSARAGQTQACAGCPLADQRSTAGSLFGQESGPAGASACLLSRIRRQKGIYWAESGPNDVCQAGKN